MKNFESRYRGWDRIRRSIKGVSEQMKAVSRGGINWLKEKSQTWTKIKQFQIKFYEVVNRRMKSFRIKVGFRFENWAFKVRNNYYEVSVWCGLFDDIYFHWVWEWKV